MINEIEVIYIYIYIYIYICGKQGVFPGRTWDPSLNPIPKYLLQ